MVWDSNIMVKKESKNFYVSSSLVSIGTTCGFFAGRNLFRNLDISLNLAIVLLCMGFSCFFSLMFIYIMRYHYAKILEKHQTEEQEIT